MNIVEYLRWVFANSKTIDEHIINLFTPSKDGYITPELEEFSQILGAIPYSLVLPTIDYTYKFEYVPYIDTNNSFCQMNDGINHFLISTKFTGCALFKFTYTTQYGEKIIIGAHIYSKYINNIKDLLIAHPQISNLIIVKPSYTLTENTFRLENGFHVESWVTIGNYYPNVCVFKIEESKTYDPDQYYFYVREIGTYHYV
ncbi:MAG: hypothetical protein IJ916_03770 [Paludibacteraceae bacterium]|nr:hypothetical protein [Paludibacteraceae bacterium]